MTILESSSSTLLATHNAIGRETRPVSSTAIGLSSVPADALAAFIQVEDDAVRMDFTSTPTSTQGIQFYPGDIIEISTKTDLDAVKFIRVTTDASLEVTYFG